MARINRSDIIQKAVNDLAISTASEKVPNETLDKVQLTYDLNKNFSSFVISTGQGTTGVIGVNTPSVSAGGETYITGINASLAKDVTCDVATGALTVTIVPFDSNITTAILRFSVITLTADNQNITLSFPYPIKVRNAQAISFTGTFTAGTMRRDMCVTGYTTSSN